MQILLPVVIFVKRKFVSKYLFLVSSHRTWLHKQLLVALSLHHQHQYLRTSRVQVPQVRLQAQDT